MSAPLDLATYRSLTRIIFERGPAIGFQPWFLANHDAADPENIDTLEIAAAAGLKAHARVIYDENSLPHHARRDDLVDFCAIAAEGQRRHRGEFPNADLVGCWATENGEFIAYWVEPLVATAGAA